VPPQFSPLGPGRLAPVDALVTGLVDYAGLFPPAALAMGPAVRSYASYLSASEADRSVLGRFVVTAARLEELDDEAMPLMRRGSAPWRVSALVGPDIEGDLARVEAFNRRHRPGRGTGFATIDAIEGKAERSRDVERLLTGRGDDRQNDIEVFVEVPTAADPSALVDDVARLGAGAPVRAKIRTGGVVADAIPPAEEIVTFLRACARAAVPFKATAGLHHPIRGSYRLTYAPDSPTATMYGFLNVFVAATFVRIGVPAADAVSMLEETAAEAFVFDADGVTWRSRRATTPAIRAARANYALSFGSCSFREPVDELRGLGL
jgi:hypothetical protein